MRVLEDQRGMLSDVILFVALMILALGIILPMMRWMNQMHATNALAQANSEATNLRDKIHEEFRWQQDYEFQIKLPKCAGITFNQNGEGITESFTLRVVDPTSGEVREKNYKLTLGAPGVAKVFLDVQYIPDPPEKFPMPSRSGPRLLRVNPPPAKIPIVENSGMGALAMREFTVRFVATKLDHVGAVLGPPLGGETHLYVIITIYPGGSRA